MGDIVFRPGGVDYDFILAESGWIEIVSQVTGEERYIHTALGPQT